MSERKAQVLWPSWEAVEEWANRVAKAAIDAGAPADAIEKNRRDFLAQKRKEMGIQ